MKKGDTVKLAKEVEAFKGLEAGEKGTQFTVVEYPHPGNATMVTLERNSLYYTVYQYEIEPVEAEQSGGTKHDGDGGKTSEWKTCLKHSVKYVRSCHECRTEVHEQGRNDASGGTKHDSDKPDLSLLPFKALEDVARVMNFGAQKYGRGNYKQGLQVTRLLAAAIRHIGAFAEREDKDPESGLPHVAHAVTNLLFIIYMIENKPEMDNRDAKL